jgi:hypothetical protein
MNIPAAGTPVSLPDLTSRRDTTPRTRSDGTPRSSAASAEATQPAPAEAGDAPAAGGYQLLGARIVSIGEPPPRLIDVLA